MLTTSIDICLCTYRRESLAETLASLANLQCSPEIRLRIIVADNDAVPSAAEAVGKFAETTDIPVQYLHAPARNISIARNACLDAATADWIAFLDDDERADENWLAELLAIAKKTDATAVFGPAKADYEKDAPYWIVEKDYHTNNPERRDGVVETGHTCNALVRREDLAVEGQRFLLEKGRTGGEDTEFFFRVNRRGGKFEIAEKALVYESIDPKRLTYSWLAGRKFRYGQSYGLHAAEESLRRQIGIVFLAIFKVLFCLFAALVFCWSQSERNYWVLRGVFHTGVVASLLGIAEAEHY